MDRSGKAWISTLSLALLLPACAAEPPAASEPAAEAPADPDTTRMYMVRLDGQRRPDLVGSAGFVPAGEATRVIAGIRGATPGGTLQGHIHGGESCDSPGGTVHPLSPIPVGADGVGRAGSTVPTTIGAVFDGGHLIVYHQEGGEPGPAVICGDIPMLVPLAEEEPADGG